MTGRYFLWQRGAGMPRRFFCTRHGSVNRKLKLTSSGLDGIVPFVRRVKHSFSGGNAIVVQLVVRRLAKAEIAGSSPVYRFYRIIRRSDIRHLHQTIKELIYYAIVVQLVVRRLAKAEIAGSSPVYRFFCCIKGKETGRKREVGEMQDLDPIIRVMENMGRVLVGMEQTTQLVLAAFLAGGHVLLEDMPGTGKTLLARAMAKSVGCSFGRIQFTPDLLPSDVTGISWYHPGEHAFRFREGPVFADIVLADEINRATPRTQAALLECMGEGQVTVDGVSRMLEDPFFVIATENPVETYGCFPLPEAQLDRFMMKLEMGRVTFEQEKDMLNRFMQADPLEMIVAVMTKEEAISLRSACREIFVHEDLRGYMVALTQRTRRDGAIREGVSPRGTMALMRAAQGYAMTCGRNFVTPEDVQAVAVPVLAHRYVGGGDEPGQSSGRVRTLLRQVEVPTENWRQP